MLDMIFFLLKSEFFAVICSYIFLPLLFVAIITAFAFYNK